MWNNFNFNLIELQFMLYNIMGDSITMNDVHTEKCWESLTEDAQVGNVLF